MIPLILGAFQYKVWKKKRSMEFSIIVLILAFLITYMHPMTTVFLIIMLISYVVARYFIPKTDFHASPINLITLIFTVLN